MTRSTDRLFLVEILGVAALTAIGAALRIGLWTRFPMWGDEIYTYNLILNPLEEIVSITAGDVHPPLYYFFARLAWLVWSIPEAIRIPSLLAGIVSLPVVWGVGRKIGGPRLGFYLLALLVVSPLHVRYSIEGRNYMVGMLTAALMFLWAVELGDPRWTLRRRWGAAVAYFLAAVAAAYTHNILTFVVLASGMTLILLALARGAVLKALGLAGLHALVLALYLPWLYVVSDQARTMGEALEWMPIPTPTVLRRTFTVFIPFCYEARLPPLPPWVENAGIAFLMLAGWGAALWARRRGGRERGALVLGIVTLLLPLALAYVCTFYFVRVFLPERSGLFLIVPYFLFPAVAAAALPWHALRPALLGLLLALMLPITIDYYIRALYGEIDRALRQVAEATTPREPLFHTTTNGWSLMQLRFYADRILGPDRLYPLHDYIDWLINEPEVPRPERLLVIDWATLWGGFSGYEGLQAMTNLEAHAEKQRLLYTAEPVGDYTFVWIFSEIDWPTMLESRRKYRESLADLDELPWNFLGDVSGLEFRGDYGFDTAAYSPTEVFRWLVGGRSEFRRMLWTPLRPGGYYFVLRLWRLLEDKPKTMELRIGGRSAGTVETVAGYHTALFPFEVRPGDRLDAAEVELLYDTWVPKEEGHGEDVRELGYLIYWYGIVRRDGFVPEAYAEEPVAVPLGELDEKPLSPGETALPLELPLLDPPVNAWAGMPIYDLLIEARFEPGGAASPEEAALRVWTDALAPISVTPWPKPAEEGEPYLYRTRLPLFPDRAPDGQPAASSTMHFLAPEAAAASWRIERVSVVRSMPSLSDRAVYPMQIE